MVNDDTSSQPASQINRGVTARSTATSSPVGIHAHSISESEDADRSGSIHDVQNDIRTALDLMGPNTSTWTRQDNNTVSDAENDESIYEFINNKAETHSTESTFSTNAGRYRIFSHLPENDSLAADLATSSTSHNFDSEAATESSRMPRVCLYHQRIEEEKEEPVQQAPQPQKSCQCVHNPEVPCRIGYMNQSTYPVVTFQSEIGDRSAKTLTTAADGATASMPSYKKNTLFNWLKEKSSDIMLASKKPHCEPCELYKMNIQSVANTTCDRSLPKRLVFDLVEGIPTAKISQSTLQIKNPIEKRKSVFTSKNQEKKKIELEPPMECGKKQGAVQRKLFFDSEGDTRVDFYYFDHGNAEYFHTTDTPPVMLCEHLAEKTERYTTRFWAEIFTTIHIGVAFAISFVLQFFKFFLYSMLRPLTVGIIQMASDYFFKPFLTALFNGLLQPVLIFLYNIATSLRDLCDPIAEAVGYFCREIAVLCNAIRLFSYNKCECGENCNRNKCSCEFKRNKC